MSKLANSMVSLAMLLAIWMADAAGSPRLVSNEKVTGGSARRSATRVLAERAAEQFRQYMAYQGTQVEVVPGLQGIPVDVQQTLSRRLAALDPRPDQRLIYFKGLTEVPNLRCNGWYGRVNSIVRSRDGYLIDVTFSPRLALPDGGHVGIDGTYRELYEYTSRGFRFVGGQGTQTATDILILN